MKSLLLAFCLLCAPVAPQCLVTIHHDPDTQSLSVVCLLNLHDLNTVIMDMSGEDPQLGTATETSDADTLIKQYLQRHLHLSFGDSALHMAYLGHKEDISLMICRLQVDSVPTAEGLTVSSDLFGSLYQDQVIDVKVETKEGVEDHPLYQNENSFTFGMQNK